MTEVVSIKFKNRGKAYFFDPNGLSLRTGDTVIVDTANGMEIATVSRENHPVEDTAVVHPLRPVIRKATQIDLRTEELNLQRAENAQVICREKIREHGLDMKLVDVECNFEGTKTTFYFTSDGRVDFRALVRDLAAVMHNRIELRQIGVRDEAKMLGGLGICGRPYCCNQFLDDFHPVSTKMAKVQSLSLNPTKISGSCGRLMCCLRYEQEAYEDLVKKVPKQGAFVETKDGYGTAVQVNLLRSTVRVRLDDDREDTLHEYKAYELATVPGGRPRDGVAPPHVLEYVEPEPDEEAAEPENEWAIPTLLVTPVLETRTADNSESGEGRKHRRRDRKPRREHSEADSSPRADRPSGEARSPKPSAGGKQPPRKASGGESGEKEQDYSGLERKRNRTRKKKPASQDTPHAASGEGQKKSGETSSQKSSRPRHYNGQRRKKSE